MSTLASRLARAANLRVLAGLAVAVGVLGMQSGGGTLAFFTSQATTVNNSFTSGTLELSINGTTGDAVTSFISSGSNFLPGRAALGRAALSITSVDATKGYIEIKRNESTGPAIALDKRIKWSAASFTGSAPTCSGTGAAGTLALPGGGTNLPISTPSSPASATDDGSGTTTSFGNFVASGATPSANLSVTAGASATRWVCVLAEWISGTDATDTQLTDNAAKGASLSYDFRFHVQTD